VKEKLDYTRSLYVF